MLYGDSNRLTTYIRRDRMATMEIIKMNHVTFQYPEMEEKVLDDVSLSVMEGQFIVLCGASGSGKTTLLRLLKQEIAPHGKQQGEILYAGKQIEEWEEIKLATEIGFVFQDPDNQIVMEEVFQEVILDRKSTRLNSSHVSISY